ncbi:MAG: tetraacyldisaccharide 4'-kinase [Acidobacteriota bacterium]|nr:tetraacyldisaccharide 4'-kinase [Acidobacteriota bacterium]
MSPLDPRPSAPRSPWQLFYGGVHRLRRRWYRRRARRLPRPVISIGNLHWGGAGKTPLVSAVGRHLQHRGLQVAVLSRGYGGSGKGVRMVSTGEGPLLGPTVAGDEPVLLAGEMPGVAVVVGPDRYQDGFHALERLSPQPQIFLLDDGFSHLALHRDLDLLVFPASDPFAGGRLWPGGRLREPLASSARAHAALLTGAKLAGADSEAPEQAQALAAALRPFGFDGPAFVSTTEARPARLHRGDELAAGSRVLLVAAIARPERFRASAEAEGFTVAGELFLPDHHPYPEATLQRIAKTFRESGADAVLTTSKDRVKLHGRLEDADGGPVPLAELPVRAEPEPAFWSWLDEEVDGLLAREEPKQRREETDP